MKYDDIEFFNEIKNICWKYLYKNYDLCYLSAMHEKNREGGTDAIIVGSSHAMNGIIEKELTEAGDVIQFSVSSQDIYYDFLHIKRALQDGKRHIKRCFINLGYYMLYQDISRSERLKGMIPNIYMNIFGEDCKHHLYAAAAINPFTEIEFDRDIFHIDAIEPFVTFWCKEVIKEQASYYGKLLSREDNNMLGVKKIQWESMLTDEKIEYAKKRAKGHNKHKKYLGSLIENERLIADMVELLYEHDVRPFFFITPYTGYYNEFIDKEYHSDIFSVLDNLQWPVDFLDMNDYQDDFDDSDFLDSDHLNLKGAQKATAILNGYIALTEDDR